MGYRPRVTSVAIVGLLLAMLASEAASQPPTVTEPPLVIEGRVLWIDFGSQTHRPSSDCGIVSPSVLAGFGLNIQRVSGSTRSRAISARGTSASGEPSTASSNTE